MDEEAPYEVGDFYVPMILFLLIAGTLIAVLLIEHGNRPTPAWCQQERQQIDQSPGPGQEQRLREWDAACR